MDTITTTTVTAKGQVTIPKPIRALMGLEAGDKVVFSTQNGHVEIQREEGEDTSPYIAGIANAYVPEKVAVSPEEMDAAIAEMSARGLE